MGLETVLRDDAVATTDAPPFETLAQLAQAVTESLELADVLDRVAHAATQLLPNSAARIWIAQAERLRLQAEWGTLAPALAGRKTDLALGEGLAGHVALTRELLVAADVLTDPRTVNVEWMRQQGYVSGVGTPLLAQGQLVGVLSLLTRHRHHFSTAELEILTSFGTLAAIAIHNARLYAETDQRRRAAVALAEVGRLISRSLDVQEVGQQVADSIRTLLSARASALYRLDPTSGDLIALATSGDSGPAFGPQLVVPRGTGVVGLAVNGVWPVTTPNLLTDPRVTLTSDLRARIERAPYRAVLAVPLVIHDRVIGALGVGDDAGRVFGAEEIQLAQAFADQAALAVENARLFEEQVRLSTALTSRQGRLEALLEVSHQLSRLQPLASLFQGIAETCRPLLGADSVGLRLVEGDDLVLAGAWGDARQLMATARVKIGESISGLVAATGQPLLVSDPANDVRLISAHREAMRRLGYQAVLAVPVKIAERVAGVLSLHTLRPAGFSAEDLAIVTAFASQVAVALDNSRLYEEVRRACDELSQTQDQLLHAQKMDAIGQLAGGIAHDFNNLLTVIGGHSQLLLNRLPAEDPLRRDIASIEGAAARAADLTRQLLAFSRKQVLDLRVIQLNTVVAELAPMLQRLIGEHIELRTGLDPTVGVVKADARQLEQVILNLAVNARDAMPAGGRLTIETANVELDAGYARQHVRVHPGAYVMLAVSDTGTGMDAETRARIFEPFFTTKGPGQGTGLGLSTVDGIVAQSGGHVWVYSELGQGTTFKVYLPRSDAPIEAAPPPPASAPAAQGSETILLVEDERGVRDLAQKILTQHGYTVLQAARGSEALRLNERHPGPLQLLLTDVVMPEMSGRVLADQLVRARPEIKVLYMSGYSSHAVVHHGVLNPGTAYLQKPFTPEGLAAKVREVLDAVLER